MAFFDFLKRRKKAKTEVEMPSGERNTASQEMTCETIAKSAPELEEYIKRARELSEKFQMQQESETCAKMSSGQGKGPSNKALSDTCGEQSVPKTSPEDGRPEQIPKAQTAASVQQQDPPDDLWIVTDEIGNPPFETIDGQQYMRLYETPEEAEAAPRMPGRALLCHVMVRRLKAVNAVYRKDNGSWLWEKIIMDPDRVRVEYQFKLYGSCTRREVEYLDPLKPNTPWPKAFQDRYVGIRMLLVEPEWFEGIRQICREWGVKLGICGNSMVGINSVEYLWSRGGPPRNKPLFLVCRLSEDNYIFSDTRHFFFAHILNALEWDGQFDKIGWRVYSKFEYALVRHCFGNGARVPLAYLGQALSSLIRHKRPTFAGMWFMQSREEGYHGIVSLCAKYALRNGTPIGVESLSLCIASGKDDPDVIDRKLVSGTDEEIRAWLQQPENQESITTIARQMLQDYEDIYTEKNVHDAASSKGDNL